MVDLEHDIVAFPHIPLLRMLLKMGTDMKVVRYYAPSENGHRHESCTVLCPFGNLKISALR